MKTVTASFDIAVPAATAIRAFTDEKMLREWWGVEQCLVDLKPGGLYTLLWGVTEHGVRYVSTGVIRAFEPAALLHVGDYLYLNPERPPLGPLELRVETQQTATGCQLTISQGPYPAGAGEHWDWYFDAVDKAWPEVIVHLKKYLEALTA